MISTSKSKILVVMGSILLMLTLSIFIYKGNSASSTLSAERLQQLRQEYPAYNGSAFITAAS